MNSERCRRLVDDAIRDLSLDLTGFRVLTEAATGSFAVTASLAALGGADQVMVMGKDSRFGSTRDAMDATFALAREWGCEQQLVGIENRHDPALGDADIITNLAGVRPIDADLIGRLKFSAVIPLMFEAWEFRSEDIDLKAARVRQLMVMGTNESHPAVDVLSYLGPLAAKLLLQSDIEVYGSRIIVLGSGVFAEKVGGYLSLANAEVIAVNVDEMGAYSPALMREAASRADALVIVDHHSGIALFGDDAPCTEKELYELNRGLVVVHISGNANREIFASTGFRLVPEHFAPPGYMSVSTAYLGPRPLVRLHAAGLKVGELMARASRAEHSFAEAQARLSEHELCQLLA